MPLARPNYEPSPEEIASECEAIRSQWTSAERRRRLDGLADLSTRSGRRTERRKRIRTLVELTPDLAAELNVRRDL